MGQYRQAKVTNVGMKLIEQAQLSTKALIFTSLKTGDGEYSGEEELRLCTSLKNIKNTFAITKVTQDEKIKVASQITNSDVPAGYDITEIGVYGNLGDGEETLIAITSSVEPDFLPSSTVTPSTIIVELYLEITNTDDVKFTYAIPEGVYATLEDFEDLKKGLETNEITEEELSTWYQVKDWDE